MLCKALPESARYPLWIPLAAMSVHAFSLVFSVFRRKTLGLLWWYVLLPLISALIFWLVVRHGMYYIICDLLIDE
jgi:hypothetical protein